MKRWLVMLLARAAASALISVALVAAAHFFVQGMGASDAYGIDQPEAKRSYALLSCRAGRAGELILAFPALAFLLVVLARRSVHRQTWPSALGFGFLEMWALLVAGYLLIVLVGEDGPRHKLEEHTERACSAPR